MVNLIENEAGARINVVGAGGGGGNAINHMIGLAEFVSVNIDSQALRNQQCRVNSTANRAVADARTRCWW